MRTDGTPTCWGDNYWGQSTPPAGTFTQVSAGDSHTCGVKTDGTLACWGYDSDGQATPPAGTFSQVSAGGYHTCGVRTDGTLACWGYDSDGQATPPAGTFSQVSAGGFHTCGVRTDGTLACWGRNIEGQATPLTGTFTQVSAGGFHTCGVRTDGTPTCWGDNDYGQATPPTGTIVIVKATDPAGGTGFGFTDNIAAPNSFGLDDGGTETFNNVFTDTYTVIEDAPGVTPGGFALSDLACTDPDGGSSVDLGTRKATIDLDAGETVTCTFTNTPPDTDSDGVPDSVDNCPLVANPGQENTDAAIGNGTGIPGDDATVPNTVADSVGDACETDPDIDYDGIPNATDPHPGGDITYDTNGNGNPCVPLGTDAADHGPSWDWNCNGVLDGMEDPVTHACTFSAPANQDTDGDGLMDNWEVCKWGTNPNLVDSDGDGKGDCVEAVDTDGNGIIHFGLDALNSARATVLPAGVGPGKFGKDGDFDLNGNNVIVGDFGKDTITTAKMTLGILPCQ